MKIKCQAKDNSQIIQRTWLACFLIMFSWILAWILKVNTEPHLNWLAGSAGSLVYWTSAKLLIWIFPAL